MLSCKFLTGAILMWGLAAHALVDMKNANYSETIPDIQVPGNGFDFKVERTYNSRSIFNGIFGFGWCSDYETRLETMPEGTLKVTECGAGTETIYQAKGFSASEVRKTVDEIIQKLKKERTSQRPDFFAQLERTLLTDQFEREKYSDDLGITRAPKVNTVYLAGGIGPDSIEYVAGTYLRSLTGGNQQKFNSKGLLVQISDRNGNTIKFSYTEDLIREITDSNGRKLTLTYYPNKKVKQILGPNNLKAEYKFENQNDLSWVQNAWGNVYSFKYDDLHNLTQIVYPDKTKKTLSYDKNKDWVTGFSGRDGCTEQYKYELSQDDPKNHYWSTLTKKCQNQVVASARYEFWYKLNKAKTDKYLARVLVKAGDKTTDTVYHESLGRPVSITNNGQIVRFNYDENTGLLKNRIEGNRILDFSYDPSCKKVSKVSDSKIVSTFQYDPKCNLIGASNTKGQNVALTYDPHGRISSLMDQARRRLNIRYDERVGKPSFVERPGLGTVSIAYKPNGEIKSFESPAGPVVAVQVAGALNNLLDLISPAGSELGL